MHDEPTLSLCHAAAGAAAAECRHDNLLFAMLDFIELKMVHWPGLHNSSSRRLRMSSKILEFSSREFTAR